MGKFIDLTGQRFERLTILKKSDKTNKRKDIYWDCICDCGNKITINGANIRNNHQKSCGCLRIETIIKNTKERWEKTYTDGGSFVCLYLRYKNGAKRRKIEFNLTKEQFKNLINQPCYYCNCLPNTKTKYNRKYQYSKPKVLYYNGIDRVDNKNGYNIKNVVTCCFTCNYAKRKMGIQEFLLWIKRVYNHSILNNKKRRSVT